MAVDSKSGSQVPYNLRGTTARRPSAESLQAIATEADFASKGGGTGGTGGGSLPHVHSSLSSSSSSPSLSNDEINLMKSLLEKLSLTNSNSSSGSGGNSGGGVHPRRANQPIVAAPSTTQPISSGISAPMESFIANVVEGGPRVDGGSDDDDEEDGVVEQKRKAVMTAAAAAVGSTDLTWSRGHIPKEMRFFVTTVPMVNAVYGGSFSQRAQTKAAKERRNRRELEFLATLLDVSVEGRPDVVNELVMRRILAIEQAEEDGNWKAAQALDATNARAIGTTEQRKMLLKHISLIKPKRSSSSGKDSGDGWEKKKKKKKSKGNGGSSGNNGSKATAATKP
jgi:hypothetical protein